ncbi:MAG: outer membrane protein assembly factor, partial [Methylotenera sp.]|nr:outer membrane protein assembly factor [Methylotenera sp.]
MKKLLLTCLLLLFWTPPVLADSAQYQVEIEAPTELKELLQKHLDMVKWRDNPRMNPAEWQRLYLLAPQNIKNLVATEGYFSPKISPSLENQNGIFTAKFTVDSGPPVLISNVDLKFTGDINQQQIDDKTSIPKLRDAWLLKTGEPFRQDDWDQAKRKLLITLLVERFPNATISNSRAEVNLDNQTVALI